MKKLIYSYVLYVFLTIMIARRSYLCIRLRQPLGKTSTVKQISWLGKLSDFGSRMMEINYKYV